MELGMSLNPLIRLPMNSNSRTKGKNELFARQFQRSPHPPLPKIEENGNPFLLPTRDQLKPVVVNVKDFFGGAKDSVGKLIALDTISSKEVERNSVEKSK